LDRSLEAAEYCRVKKRAEKEQLKEKKEDNREDSIAQRPRKGYPDVSALGVLHVHWVYGNRLGPAKHHGPGEHANQWKYDRSENVDVSNRVQTDSPHIATRGVTKLICRPRVRSLVERKRKEENYKEYGDV